MTQKSPLKKGKVLSRLKRSLLKMIKKIWQKIPNKDLNMKVDKLVVVLENSKTR